MLSPTTSPRWHPLLALVTLAGACDPGTQPSIDVRDLELGCCERPENDATPRSDFRNLGVDFPDGDSRRTILLEIPGPPSSGMLFLPEPIRCGTAPFFAAAEVSSITVRLTDRVADPTVPETADVRARFVQYDCPGSRTRAIQLAAEGVTYRTTADSLFLYGAPSRPDVAFGRRMAWQRRPHVLDFAVVGTTRDRPRTFTVTLVGDDFPPDTAGS